MMHDKDQGITLDQSHILGVGEKHPGQLQPPMDRGFGQPLGHQILTEGLHLTRRDVRKPPLPPKKTRKGCGSFAPT